MDEPCTSLSSKGKNSLPGRPLPKAHWTGTYSLLPSTPGPRGSDIQPPVVGLQPPAPGERWIRMGEGAMEPVWRRDGRGQEEGSPCPNAGVCR